MRRGPDIGGHLPRIPKEMLEQMPAIDRAAYHLKRAEVFRARAKFFSRVALVAAAVAVAVLVASPILRLAG